MVDLAGRVAVVTGSSRGIGYAIAQALAARGARVVVSSRSEQRVEEAARLLRVGAPGEVHGVPCDVRDPDACGRLVAEAVARFGGLDVLVNNAGVGIFESILDTSLEDFRAQLETNLAGVFYCSKAAAPHLIRSGDGWIVNVGSLAGRNAFAGGVAYNATKFGLIGMSEAMMLDLRQQGVRVSLVMPGSVDTDFQGGGSGGRPWALTPDDVARAVLGLFAYPPNAHVSRVEMRPSKPVKS
jgi:NAD(P)-dependent dehydrogenase (short-subunit alcohol dehydrogenase family)